MIPERIDDIDRMIEDIGAQNAELDALTSGLSSDSLLWRPTPQKWSITGHVAHLAIVNGPYLNSLRECARVERSRERPSDGPYKHPWFGRWFAGQMAPPPAKRWKTTKVMIPDPGTTPEAALADFSRIQTELCAVIEEVRGLDLGKARFSSPFARIVRLSIGTGLGLILGHNRRHLWLAREVVDWEGFPGAPA